jgi:hypothetical protein
MAVQVVGSSNSEAVDISEKGQEVLGVVGVVGVGEQVALFGAVSGRVKGKYWVVEGGW